MPIEATVAAAGVAVVGWLVSPFVSDLLGHKFFKKWEKNRELKKGLDEEMERLRAALVQIQSITEDAEEKQFKNPDLHDWVRRLKEELLDAEDVLALNEVEVELLLRKQRDEELSSKKKVISSFLHSLRSSSSSRLSVAEEIEKISKRLVDIRKEGVAFGLEKMVRSAPAAEDSALFQKRQTSSFLEAPVVGRDDVKEEMIKQLVPAAAERQFRSPTGGHWLWTNHFTRLLHCLYWLLLSFIRLLFRRTMVDSGDDRRTFVVHPIVGMGGLGKTTLAQLVFNDSRVAGFYKSKAWVCVGRSYHLDLIRTTASIVESVRALEGNKEASNFEALEALQNTLVNEIEESFLLVLDDAWDKDILVWEELLAPLKNSKKRCRVIVTTRDQKVADAFTDVSHVWRLGFLDEETMGSIFARAAFRNAEDASNHLALELIGREIVKRLKGLPLAAKTIGGILRRSRNKTDWQNILNSERLLNQNNQDEDYMLSILMLSYHNLPAIVKRFFSCISLFPKDYEFLYENLDVAYHRRIFIDDTWMIQRISLIGAEIDSRYSSSYCVDELLDRSLLQYMKRSTDMYISVQDSIHDMAELINKEEFVRIDDDTEKKSIPKKVRHISFFQKSVYPDPAVLKDLSNRKSLRTLIYDNRDGTINGFVDILDCWFQNLRYLRVLSMHNRYITSLPKSIGHLKLLRYLDLCLPAIEELPSTISELQKLQGLNLLGCGRLRELPSTVTRLVNLVHLDVKPQLLQKVNGIGKFRNLQELVEFHVEERHGHEISQLENMNGLCGSLYIRNLENVRSGENAQEARLHKKEKLQRLNLCWSRDQGLQDDIAEGLRPHAGLEELSINGYRGTRLPNWLTDTYLIRLVHLHVLLCFNLENIPSLPRTLQSLQLSSDRGLKSLFSSSSSPPPTSLQTLKVVNCRELDKSLDALVEASSSSLVNLSIQGYSCPLKGLSCATALSDLKLCDCKGEIILNFTALTSLAKMEIDNCPNVQVHSGPELCSTLTSLSIANSPVLELLVQRRVLLTSLTDLSISDSECDDSAIFECLHNATALKKLSLRSCTNITSLPSELMHGLLPMSLQSLVVRNCPKLKELYEQGKQRFSRIPHVSFS